MTSNLAITARRPGLPPTIRPASGAGRVLPLLCSLAGAGALFAAADARAGAITFLGTDVQANAQWRTEAATKTFQINGSNVYGQLGYVLLGSSIGSVEALPSGVSVTRDAASIYPGNGGYLSIDNPTAAGSITSGVWYSQGVDGAPQPYLTVSFSVARDLTVGLYTNNTDVAAISPSSLRIAQVAGVGSGDSGAIANAPSRTGTWFFFEVSGAAGDAFQVSGVKTPGWDTTGIAVLSFDLPTSVVAVPEPGSMALLGAGLLGLGLARRVRAGRQDRPPSLCPD